MKRLGIVDMPQLQPDDVGALSKAPSLENLIAGPGSGKKNDAVQRLVPLPRGEGWRRPVATIDY